MTKKPLMLQISLKLFNFAFVYVNTDGLESCHDAKKFGLAKV